jgi:Uma2 family endonuclease
MTTHALQNIKFTYEDYLLFPEDGKRHELIDGDYFMSPAPRTKHQRISSTLHRMISGFVYERKLGHLFAAPTDVVLSDISVVQPDMLFISTARAAIITDKNIQGAPDLVVEILSESSRKTDEITKRKLYEMYGVCEYWIIDPELSTVKVYRTTDKGYVRTNELSVEANESLNTPLLQGLSISLSELFD